MDSKEEYTSHPDTTKIASRTVPASIAATPGENQIDTTIATPTTTKAAMTTPKAYAPDSARKHHHQDEGCWVW